MPHTYPAVPRKQFYLQKSKKSLRHACSFCFVHRYAHIVYLKTPNNESIFLYDLIIEYGII